MLAIVLISDLVKKGGNMAKNIRAIPEGYHSVNPNLVVSNGVKAIEFYKKAFGAVESYRKMGPGNRLMHAELKIGDSIVMLGEECPDHPGHAETCPKAPFSLEGTSVNFFLYVENSDDVFKQAINAGARIFKPLENMFWGDRVGMVIDPFGHFWSIATHVEDVSSEEVDKRMEAMFKDKK
jgi:PhnB protein